LHPSFISQQRLNLLRKQFELSWNLDDRYVE
jgi:hypothetical protein